MANDATAEFGAHAFEHAGAERLTLRVRVRRALAMLAGALGRQAGISSRGLTARLTGSLGILPRTLPKLPGGALDGRLILMLAFGLTGLLRSGGRLRLTLVPAEDEVEEAALASVGHALDLHGISGLVEQFFRTIAARCFDAFEPAAGNTHYAPTSDIAAGHGYEFLTVPSAANGKALTVDDDIMFKVLLIAELGGLRHGLRKGNIRHNATPD